MSNTNISDESLERIKALLGGRVRDLRVLICEERIVLQGNANTYYGKQMAQHLVLKLVAATTLVNEIEVRRPVIALNPDSAAAD